MPIELKKTPPQPVDTFDLTGLPSGDIRWLAATFKNLLQGNDMEDYASNPHHSSMTQKYAILFSEAAREINNGQD